MRKVIYSLTALCLAGIIIASCSKNKLDNVDPIDDEQRSVSGEGIIASGVVADNESVRVPFKITLDAPAKKAFQVGITLNTDTITKLISNGTLTNTVALPSGSVDYPNVINVPYGATSAVGEAVVRLNVLEKNFGKDVAFAFKLAEPGKGNQISAKNSNIMVIMDSDALIKESDIHYISIQNGAGILDVDFNKNYNKSWPGGITVPIAINLAGKPAGAFNVKIELDTDTLAKLIANKVLPANTIALKPDEFTLDTNIRIVTGASGAVARLQIGWPTFDANIIANKRFGFVLKITDPTKHLLDPVKNYVIVLVQPEVNLDNNSYITGNGTGLKAEYFSDYQFLDQDGRKPTLVRIEENINWTGDGPWQNATPGISRDNFSTRWTGEFLAPVRGEYKFYQTEWDDGSRLYVDGKALVNDFTDRWDVPERVGTIFLERGKRYKIEAHHRENVGGQRAILAYEVKNATEPKNVIISKRVIPMSQLFPAPLN
ncbi:PA14 domain-containing protein [Mucilaginibacter defluvii]|uniref:PA14 domain-containing protein n=1 Tax=Mucilaginibacter defluvii TaxID=1196019 RepID=A0ABP9FQN8_9SPHI